MTLVVLLHKPLRTTKKGNHISLRTNAHSCIVLTLDSYTPTYAQTSPLRKILRELDEGHYNDL